MKKEVLIGFESTTCRSLDHFWLSPFSVDSIRQQEPYHFRWQTATTSVCRPMTWREPVPKNV